MSNSNSPPETHPDQDEIPVRYQKADDYQILTATGGRGGIQPPGNFKMDFILDYTTDLKRKFTK